MKTNQGFFIILALILTIFPITARAGEQGIHTVSATAVADEKAVFATVESINVIPARARNNGTVAELKIHEGDRVEQGQVIALVGDEKLALQVDAIESRIAGLEAQLKQAQIDLDRVTPLVPSGAAPKSSLDQARTAYTVADNSLKTASSERDVIRRQMQEGEVLAPVAGRVLKIPVTAGTVVLPGETIAMVAEENYVLRLRVPERHAISLKLGDPVRLDTPELGERAASTGKIVKIYPQIEQGRVIADAEVEGLGSYFVGERVRVWISGGQRSAIILPDGYITTRFGTDYARIRQSSGSVMDVPVQRGQSVASGVEILSGLKMGDVLVKP